MILEHEWRLRSAGLDWGLDNIISDRLCAWLPGHGLQVCGAHAPTAMSPEHRTLRSPGPPHSYGASANDHDVPAPCFRTMASSCRRALSIWMSTVAMALEVAVDAESIFIMCSHADHGAPSYRVQYTVQTSQKRRRRPASMAPGAQAATRAQIRGLWQESEDPPDAHAHLSTSPDVAPSRDRDRFRCARFSRARARTRCLHGVCTLRAASSRRMRRGFFGWQHLTCFS